MKQRDLVGIIAGVILMLAGVAGPLLLWQLGFILSPIPAPRLSPTEAAQRINSGEIIAVGILNEERMVLFNSDGDRFILDTPPGSPYFEVLLDAGTNEDIYSTLVIRLINRPPILDIATIFIYGMGALAIVAGFMLAVVRGRTIRVE